MKKIILIILIALLNINGQVKQITLSESIQIALSNSKEVKIAESKYHSAEAEEKEYKANLLPKLSVNASYVRLSDVDPFQITMPFSPNPIKIQDVVLDTYTLKATLQQPLFTGFRLSSLKNAAEKRKEAAEIDLDLEKNKVSLQVQTAFFNFYKTSKVVELLEENSKRLKKHLDDTKNFLDNGLVTKNDYLKIEVQYNNNELQKINAVNNNKIARSAFNKSLGININEQTEINTENLSVTDYEIRYEQALEEAKQNRSELKSASMRLESVNSLVTASKGSWYPAVYLFANAYYNKPNQRIQPIKDEFNETWDAGISLSWDIWDWGITSAKSKQAEEQYAQTELQIGLLNENIELEVYSNYLKVISEQSKITVTKAMLKSAEENYRITKEKYNTQLANSTDLLDAETSLLDAEISNTNAAVDLKLAILTFEKSLGRKIY